MSIIEIDNGYGVYDCDWSNKKVKYSNNNNKLVIYLNELTEDKEREGKKKSTKEYFKAKLKVTAVKAE